MIKHAVFYSSPTSTVCFFVKLLVIARFFKVYFIHSSAIVVCIHVDVIKIVRNFENKLF